jgi:hypothetical protein
MSEGSVDPGPDDGSEAPAEDGPRARAATPAEPLEGRAGPQEPSAPEPERNAGHSGQRTWNGRASRVPGADGSATVGDSKPDNVADSSEESLDPRYDEKDSRSREVRSDFPRGGGPQFDIHGREISTGDIAGNIYHLSNWFAAGETQARGPISTGHLTRTARVHVTTGSDATLEQFGREDRLVFLRGRRESGRRSSAIVVLDELTGRDRTKSMVTVLEATSGISGLAERLEEGHGHLLDASGEDWLDMVSEARAAEIQAALGRGRGGYLIVMADTETARALPGALVDHELPDLAQVVIFQLAAKVAGNQDVTTGDRRAARRLLGEARSTSGEAEEWHREITGTATDAATAPAEAALLAEAIWEWGERRETDDAAPLRIRHYRELRRYQQARLLLRRGERNDSPLRQAYVISASVFDGLAVSEVADGARQLARLLEEVERPGESGGRLIFAEPLRHWLSHVAIATAAETDRPRIDGGTPIARMPSRQLARTIIEVAWLDYDAARLPLLRWLVQLCGEHQDDRVRVRAAQALAVIAGHDYRQIRLRVLEPWSHSGKPIQYQAAAWLLEAATLDGVVAEQVRSLLWRWSRSGDRGKRAIAVRAYGTAASMTAPRDAIRGVRISAADATFGTLPELALREMYVLGLQAEVLTELTFWTRAFPPMRERVGRVLVRISRARRPDDTSRGAYDLLWRMTHEPEKTGIDLTAFAELWKLACQQHGSRGAAWQMLGFWAESCQDRPAERETFTQLVDTFEKTADSAGLRARLRVYRRRWSSYLGQEDKR